jgi:tRNA threonylcarbamoyladenosine biosynthesis protein TsaE
MEWQVALEGLSGFASDFWKAVGTAKVFAFHGEMGAGKTTTIAALCKAKEVIESPSSPTFSVINEYGYSEAGAFKSLFHIDLYRLKDEADVNSTGVEDCVYGGAICFVEWPEKAPYLFDSETCHVIIKPLAKDTRQVRILSHQEFAAFSLAEQL